MALMKKLKKEILEIAKNLRKSILTNFGGLVNYYVLQELEIGIVLIINDSINTVIQKGENYVDFYTIMPPLCSFDSHWHDNQELIIVIDGALKDSEHKKINLKKGDRHLYTFGLTHTPYNPSKVDETHLYVRHYIKQTDESFDLSKLDNL